MALKRHRSKRKKSAKAYSDHFFSCSAVRLLQVHVLVDYGLQSFCQTGSGLITFMLESVFDNADSNIYTVLYRMWDKSFHMLYGL